jgi:hypothetical protein
MESDLGSVGPSCNVFQALGRLEDTGRPTATGCEGSGYDAGDPSSGILNHLVARVLRRGALNPGKGPPQKSADTLQTNFRPIADYDGETFGIDAFAH